MERKRGISQSSEGYSAQKRLSAPRSRSPNISEESELSERVSELSIISESGSIASSLQSNADKPFEIDEEDVNYLTQRDYELGDTLCSGSYGSVYKGERLADGIDVAIKVVKSGFGYSNSKTLENEKNIIQQLIQWPHENILTFYEVLVTPDRRRTYIVSELSKIGDLYDALQVTNDQGVKVWTPLSEHESRHMIRGIAEGLKHMHGLGIAHGDLKPENILLFEMVDNRTESEKKQNFKRLDHFIPKLTDFGQSKRHGDTDPVNQVLEEKPKCSLNYAAPESYENDIGFYDMIIADMFSIGCVLIDMLLCRPFDLPMESPARSAPQFTHNKFKSLCTKMKKDIGYTESLCSYFYWSLRQLLLRLLDPNPNTRMTLDEFLAHEWLSHKWFTEFRSRGFENVEHELRTIPSNVTTRVVKPTKTYGLIQGKHTN